MRHGTSSLVRGVIMRKSNSFANRADPRDEPSRVGERRWNSGCANEPVAEIVPNTQPICSRPLRAFNATSLSGSISVIRCGCWDGSAQALG